MDNQQHLPNVPPPSDDMAIIRFVLDALRTQGLSFLLLGVAVWYLQQQNMELRKDVQDCQAVQIEFLTKKNEGLTQALEKNTTALSLISAVLNKPRR